MTDETQASAIEALINYLDHRGNDWTYARDITRRFGWVPRMISDVAAATDGRVLSGNDGYMLDVHATRADILAAYSTNMHKALSLSHRANSMIANAKRRGLLSDAEADSAKNQAEMEFVKNLEEMKANPPNPEIRVVCQSRIWADNTGGEWQIKSESCDTKKEMRRISFDGRTAVYQCQDCGATKKEHFHFEIKEQRQLGLF